MKQSQELFENLYFNFINILPNLLMALGFIIGAVLFYKITVWLVNKFLKISKIEKLNQLINENELLSNSNIKIDLAKVILGILKFVLILIICIVGSEFLHLTIVSEQIGKLLAYLPQLFTGLLIFIIGVYFASQAKRLVHSLIKSLDSGGAKALSNVVFYLILIFSSITALNQIGVETEIISTNITYFIGAALIAITIAVGLGSRDIIYRLILGFYTKKNLEIGMIIKIEDQIGTIESIDNICLVLKTENDKIVYPIKKINDTEIKIIHDSE